MKKIAVIFTVLFMMLNQCMPVLAQENEILTVNTELEVDVNAKSCILMDCNTGTVLAAKNEHEKLYPASVTKIMTLLLVCEAIDNGKLTLDMEITCSESAANKGGSQIWLEPGEVMTVNELLKAACVSSANDACCLLGEVIAGDEKAFCIMMNEKAKNLGMNNTHFDNCTGLDDDTDTHKTTAYDIALMSRELMKYDIIRNYSTLWMDTLRNGETQLVNTNKLIRTYPGATGLKTGTTSKAGCCVSATAERDGLHLIAVVLGADNSKARFSGAKNLLDWGFANYEIYYPVVEGSFEKNISITGGVKEMLSLDYSDVPSVLINKGSAGNISIEAVLPESISAPVVKDQKIGEILIRNGKEIIGKCDIFSLEDIEEMTFINAVKALLKAFSK